MGVLERNIRALPRREVVLVAESFGRVLYEDVASKADFPPADSSQRDGYAVRSLDLAAASETNPASLKVVRGAPLGAAPTARVKSDEAHTVLTGGYIPAGADAVVQSENVRRGAEEGTIIVTERVRKGQYVFPKGRDVKRGEVVLERGRVLRATDQVLLESLHMDRVGVCRKPRVAIIPTGNELSSRIRGTEPGKVVETHGLLLSRLVEGAGGVPNLMPIVRDDLALLVHSMRRALKVADLVLNSAGSSVGEADLTEKVIAQSGKPGMLVHGMKVLQGRVMGFGAVDGKAIVIIPGRIAGAVNAFAVLGYPVIRSFLGRGFEGPPSLPATVGSDWEAESHYSDFLKLVYARLRAEGTDLIAEPSWSTSEKITHFTRNDGYILVPEDKLSLKKGERVLVHVLPGISGYGSWGSL